MLQLKMEHHLPSIKRSEELHTQSFSNNIAGMKTASNTDKREMFLQNKSLLLQYNKEW